MIYSPVLTMALVLALSLVDFQSTAAEASASNEPAEGLQADLAAGRTVWVRAHRGGGAEAPENTLAALQHAWGLEDTIPEVDLQTTIDGVLICLHDDTLARTTNAPEAIRKTLVSELTLEEVLKWDAGVKLGERFAGERVPRFAEVLALLRARPERQLYVDAKGAEFARILEALKEHGVAGQVIFCGDAKDGARGIPGARTFGSVTGTAERIKERFGELAAADFDGMSHLQLHLKTSKVKPALEYALEPEFIRDALRQTKAAGVSLQLRPFRFDADSMAALLDLGVRNFEANEPQRMRECIRAWQRRNGLAPAYFQAHRGGMDEVPENTLAAFRYAWQIQGAVPEVDVQTTKDGVLVCVHDDTLARTTDAPEGVKDTPVSELTFEEIRKWDAGVRFDNRYAGERVPSLDELLTLMQEFPESQLYLDIKGVDFEQLRAILAKHGVTERVIFVHGSQDTCAELQEFFKGARTMTWIGGSPEEAKAKFEGFVASGFRGVSQLQFHLKVKGIKPEITYTLEPEYLAYAAAKARAAGVELQLRPFRFDGKSLSKLMDLGVRWYVADAPKAFAEAVAAAQEAEAGREE